MDASISSYSGEGAMREGTLVSSWENAHNFGCLHLGSHLPRQTNDSGAPCWEFNVPFGLVILPILFSSLGLHGCESRLYLWCVGGDCLYLPRSSLELSTPCLFFFFFFHLVDSRVLRTGEAVPDVKPQMPPNLPGNSPRSFWRCLMMT